MSKTNVSAPSYLVLGIGGAGTDIVITMSEHDIPNVSFICIDSLQKINLPKDTKITYQSLENYPNGTGGNLQLGRDVALKSTSKIQELLEGHDLVFIIAGLGGGTGSGMAPVVVDIAHQMGIHTMVMAPKPFGFEGETRQSNAKTALDELLTKTCVFEIDNAIFSQAYWNKPMIDVLNAGKTLCLEAIKAITNPTDPFIELDDIKRVLSHHGHAIIAYGSASGADKSTKATQEALSSPLLEPFSDTKAKGILVHITYHDRNLKDLDTIASLINPMIDAQKSDVFYSLSHDETMTDELKITIIATGLTHKTPK